MFEFKFPDVGEGITEGTIVRWKVKEGDSVKSDQVVAEIETDKAVVEVPCPKSGRITRLNHKEGEIIKVGEVLVVIDDGSVSSDKPEKSDKPKEPYTGSVVGFLEEAKGISVKKEEVHKEAKDRVKATLKIRKMAQDLGIDLETLEGSGPDGRIVESDLTKNQGKSVPKNAASTGPSLAGTDAVDLKGIKKTISDAMMRSITSTAQVTNFYDLDATSLWEKRNKEKAKAEKKGIKLTFLAYVVKAVSETLKEHPLINSSVQGDKIVKKSNYNIGVAVDTDSGLMVPVINDADKKELFDIAKEIIDLAEKAKARTIKADEMKNGTFTISNLGSVGVKYFTPILNYPESAILGLGSIEDVPKVLDGKVVIRKVMPLSLTYDHRIIDGATASRFMIDLMKSLE
jgi:pyruvate dehydrogenase E2 component (dihydrolipoamide acetyltransferase)